MTFALQKKSTKAEKEFLMNLFFETWTLLLNDKKFYSFAGPGLFTEIGKSFYLLIQLKFYWNSIEKTSENVFEAWSLFHGESKRHKISL